jgi:transposase-like protein
VRRALAALLGGAIGKDIVSRTWRKVETDWNAWNVHSLADEPTVHLVLDGTVVRVRLDRKATSISLLVVIGVPEDGHKVLLAVKNMGDETAEVWRTVLDDLVGRGLHRSEFLIVDGGKRLDAAIAALWDGVPVQCCTAHKHRNLLTHARERLHEEITADCTGTALDARTAACSIRNAETQRRTGHHACRSSATVLSCQKTDGSAQ